MSVVVPAMNAAATLPRTLAALAAQDLDAAFEVIVVDNGSDDETGAVAERGPGPVRVVRQRRTGPGAARNRGVAEAGAAMLAFTDADCSPRHDWLRRGLEALGRVALVQGMVLADPTARRGPFDRTLWVTSDRGLYQTANLFVRRAAFEAAGGFEDWLPTNERSPFGEDVLFAWRARRAGAHAAFAPDAVVHHAVFPRGPRGYLRERARLAYFPALVHRVPELRRSFLRGRTFLTPRTAAFDAAVVGALAAGATASPLPLVAAAPYAALLGRYASGWRRRAPLVTAVELAADAAGMIALVRGSVRRRCPVL